MQRELPFRKDEKKWSSSSRVNSIFRTYDREKRQPLYLKKKKRSFRWKWRLLLRIANAFLVEWGTLGDRTVGSLELVDVTNNGSDEWTSEGTSFGVKCVFDGVVISPELFHRRLIGNVDERPLRFPAYRIPPLESRFACTYAWATFFFLSLFYSFAFDFFFPSRRNFVPFFFRARIRSEIVTRCAMIFNSTRNSLAIVIKGDRKKGIVE